MRAFAVRNHKGSFMNRTYANFYEMLAAACRKNGNGTAVFDGKEKTAYRALKQEAEAVAAYLQNIGVKFGDTVALAVSNSTEFITAYFAVSAIGAVAVPMNTFLKNSEYAYILNDCKARFLFASAGLSKELAGLKAQTPVEKSFGRTKAGRPAKRRKAMPFLKTCAASPKNPTWTANPG